MVSRVERIATKALATFSLAQPIAVRHVGALNQLPSAAPLVAIGRPVSYRAAYTPTFERPRQALFRIRRRGLALSLDTPALAKRPTLAYTKPSMLYYVAASS